MRMKLFVAAIVVLSVGLTARADTFTFALTSNGQSGSGTLTGAVDPYNASAFDITSGSGTFGAYNLSLVTPTGNTQTFYNYPLGNPAGYSYNNVLYTTGSPVDYYGLLFYLDGGPNVLNIFNNGGIDTGNGPPTTPVTYYPATFTVSTAATPEPSSLVLLGTGLLSTLAAVRRRFR